MSDPREPTAPGQGLQVIHVALYRMGTKSCSEAYRILGYKAHHALDEGVFESPWPLLEQAAEATWPDVPGAKPRPRFTRADWDELWGREWDVTTDMSCTFADQLIEAYPEAKVVIVQRDFDSWWPSFQSELLDGLLKPGSKIFVAIATYVLGIRAGVAMTKVHYGFFGAKNYEEIQANSRKTYNAYYERIRAMVPPERRLEYKLSDGWEPLCAFLGKDVPEVPFPRLNNRQQHNEERAGRVKAVLTAILKTAAPWVIALTGAGIGWYYVRI